MSKLEKELRKLQDEQTALVEQRETLEAEAEKLQAEAEKSLAGVALGKLLGKARSQAERRVEAEGVALAIEEIDRRLEALKGDIRQLKQEIVKEELGATQNEIDEIELEAARHLEAFVQATEKALKAREVAAGRASAVGLPGRRRLAVTFDEAKLTKIKSLLGEYGRAYARRTGEEPPVVTFVATSDGWVPARKEHLLPAAAA